MKQAYTIPEIMLHGSIKKLTLNGVLNNADVKGGASGSANCPAGSTDPRCISG